MVKAGKAKKMGRPKAANPLSVPLHVRISEDVRAGIEAYQKKYGDVAELHELSDAVRHMLKRVLREEGLLK
jgi:hypothetical protein